MSQNSLEVMLMDAEVVRSNDKKEFPTPELCHILELWNRVTDPHVSIVRARVKTGVTTQAHSLEGVSERYLIISGSGQVYIEGLGSLAVCPGDLVFIPPGAIQYIENTGHDDLIFYAICTPRFTENVYRDRTNG